MRAHRSDRRRHLAAWLGRVLPLSVKGARSLRHLGADPRHAYALKHAYGSSSTDAKTRLYSGDFAAAVRYAIRSSTSRGVPRVPIDGPAGPRHVRGRADLHGRRHPDKVDRMSMAVSLEAREPLLDHKLLEFAARVPPR